MHTRTAWAYLEAANSCQFFGHVHWFRSYSFGHLDSIKWITLKLCRKSISLFLNIWGHNSFIFKCWYCADYFATSASNLMKNIIPKMASLNFTFNLIWEMFFFKQASFKAVTITAQRVNWRGLNWYQRWQNKYLKDEWGK